MSDVPDWERRLKSLVGHPKVGKAISEDLIHCLTELHILREELKKLKEIKETKTI